MDRLLKLCNTIGNKGVLSFLAYVETFGRRYYLYDANRKIDSVFTQKKTSKIQKFYQTSGENTKSIGKYTSWYLPHLFVAT